MRRSELEASFDMKGAFNNAACSLLPGANPSAVIKAFDALTEPQGGLGACTREDQVSHRFVSDELAQLRAMASIPPAIFLFVAGGWMGRGMTRMYVKFFRFPQFVYELPPAVVFGAAAFAGAAALIGVLAAVREAARLPPAEAMRPEPQAVCRPTLIERLGVQEWFSQTARMVLRQIERQPVKAAMSVLGVALAVAVMILGSFSKDIITFIIDFQFQRGQRQDAIITFNEPSEGGVLHALDATPGARKVEGFRNVATRLRCGHRTHLVGIMGLPDDHSLFQLLDMNAGTVALPLDGMIISQSLAV
jgi:putative ABC transport system permease protein